MKLSRKNLNKYMNKEGLSTDFQLLELIYTKLNDREPYKHALSERSNFNKMINGKCSLKVEYIIPLETIFGVPIAKLTDKDCYSEPSKEFIPYVKGFRYYAYIDNPKVYEEEFSKIMPLDSCHSILINQDEFGKTFLDYVVLYKSINAIKFLQKHYDFRSHQLNNNMFAITFNGSLEIIFGNNVEIAKMILEKGEVDLFYKVFNFNTSFHLSHLDLEPSYQNEEILEFLLKDETAFKSLFQEFKSKFIKINRHVSMFGNIPANKVEDVVRINPLINRCLEYGVNHLNEFRNQIIQILNHGSKYNSSVLKSLNEKYSLTQNDLYTNQFGDLYTGRDIVVGRLVVFNGDITQIQDSEITQLLNGLPSVIRRY